jgi:hypothetical protein
MDALLDLKLKPWKKGHVSPVDCSIGKNNCTACVNTLPALPYDYAALEPFIDAETMRVSYIWRWSV